MDSAVQEQSEMQADTAPVVMQADTVQGGVVRVVEAMLFATAAPLTTNAIRERLPEGADVGGALMELQRQYESRGVTLSEMDGTWAFRTAPDLGEALQIRREVRRKMSRAGMETLAIIAYHQPVTRAEIENIRGVETNKGTLDVLMETGWIKPGRRRETPGRPLTWVTTASFLDHFGLESLSDLPGLDDLKSSGLLDRRPAIETLAATGSLFGDEAAIEADAAAGDDDEEEEEEGEFNEDALMSEDDEDESGAGSFEEEEPGGDESDDEDVADEGEEDSDDEEDEDGDDEDEDEDDFEEDDEEEEEN